MLKLGYLVLTILMSLLILVGYRKVLQLAKYESSEVNKKFIIALVAMIIWHIYVYATASARIYLDFSFPPKFFVLMILPLFIGIGIFAFKNKDADWVLSIPKQWLVLYQTFRIVIESLFVFSVASNILHPEVTIEGYNYDMIFALSAIMIWFLAYKKGSISDSLVKKWNYLGLIIIAWIIILFQATGYFPELFGSEETLWPKAFGTYPYVLIAGFLMPSAVFIHVVSIIRLKK